MGKNGADRRMAAALTGSQRRKRRSEERRVGEECRL